MTLETRLRRTLEEQRDAVPVAVNALPGVIGRGRRRSRWRQGAVAFAAAAAMVMFAIATPLLLNRPGPVAASPTTGAELPITHEAPTVLQARLGPVPDHIPEGTDLTFATIDEPTEADLEAIREVISLENYDSPVIVSLGEIRLADTRVYVIHDVDPDTRSGSSTVLAVGPGFPSFEYRTGPTEQATWSLSASRGLDGDGWLAVGVPDFVAYFQVDIDGTTIWQRPADGFIWLPFTADPEDEIIVTGHDATGRVYLRQTIPAAPTETIEEAQAVVDAIDARIAAAAAAIAAGGGDSDELEALKRAREDAIARLEAVKRHDTGG